MLAKSRTSALIMVIAFLLCWAGSYFPIFIHLGGGADLLTQQSSGVGLSLVMVLLIGFIMAIFVSRMHLVVSLGERGFGLGGLARWCVLGMLTGTSGGLMTALFAQMSKTDLRDGLESLVSIGVVFIFYWLIFQHSPLMLRTISEIFIPDRRMVWVVIILAVMVMVTGFVLLATISPAPLWPAAYVNFGLGALNITAAELTNQKPARRKTLIPAGLFLMFMGLLTALLGVTA